jgi:hypothetical protein
MTVTEPGATTEEHTVYTELFAAIRQHKPTFRAQRESDTDADHIERVLQAIADVPDEIYNALSAEAQNWFARAAETANAGGVPAPPDGFVSGYKPKQPKAAKKKLITRERPQKAQKALGPTMGTLIRRAIIDNRHATVQDLEAMLAANGFTDIKRSTVFSFQRGSLDTLRVAEAMGRFYWPEPAATGQPAEQAAEQPAAA